METTDAIRARRNVRRYRPDPISDADLDRIAEADRPLTPIRTPDRRPFSEVVHHGHW